MALGAYFAVSKQTSHGSFEFGLGQAYLLCLGFLDKERWPVSVRVCMVADVAAFDGKALQQIDEYLLRLTLARDLVEAGKAGFGQEQAIALAEHDIFAERPVLVFLELEFAQIIIRLFAVDRLDGCQILPEAEGAVPRRRARQAGAGRHTLQAGMAQHGDRAFGDHRQRLHVRREGINLGAVYFIAGEGTRHVSTEMFFGLISPAA